MDKVVLTCVEVTPMEGFAVVSFAASSDEETMYISGNIGIQMFDGSGFKPGNTYGLDLELITEGEPTPEVVEEEPVYLEEEPVYLEDEEVPVEETEEGDVE